MGKLEDITKEIAPTLAKHLTGPLQEQALQFVFKRLKVNSKEEAENKLEQDTSALPQLRGAERDLEQAIEGKIPEGKRKDWPQVTLTLLYNVGYFIVLIVFIATMFSQGLVLDEWVKGVIGTLLGSLTTGLHAANDYWFKSSSGSASKNDLLANKSSKT